jgi:hypothetical protein
VEASIRRQINSILERRSKVPTTEVLSPLLCSLVVDEPLWELNEGEDELIVYVSLF